ncbi:BTB/POZ domain-containing protein [Rhizophagus clarus]|uniref:BTB/POZ domain-containing protein n=1 Tax=Rhizophagus clarus TaxID=94130 RepID=A0A8H3LE73_9GLOM|nr:BTB/POZ domain-containing protein [Rhizophagus clarus]
MTFESPQEVINDLEKLLINDDDYDVIIYAGENENVKEIYAHSNILRTRSQYFRTAFSNKWAEKKNGKYIFKKPNISHNSFKIILRFIYCGKVDLTKLQGPDIIKLLIATDEINIPTLIHYIQEYLIKHQDKFLQQSPIEILESVYQHETFTELWNVCLEKICMEPDIIFKSDKFIGLKAPLLELLLKRDDLLLDEIIVWDNLVKWCLAQHTNISEDPTQWNKETVTTMERTIHRFVPLIRFNHISSEDFILKVYPFKKIIPKDLINNMLIFNMAPNKQLNVNMQSPRKPKFTCDSVIIERQHFAIFSGWIEKKNDSYYNVRNIPYNFDLLYRASRDGNTAVAFHSKCDNKGATIVVAKIQNSEQIIGGYNPLFWDQSNSSKSTYDSFIFSFTNRNNLQTAKVGQPSISHVHAIYCHQNYGPTFGGGHDLHISYNNNGSYSNPHSYTNSVIPNQYNINIADFEVFQVNKK